MYDLCPNCRKLMDDKATVCPHCGKSSKDKRKTPSQIRQTWWCTYCRMSVTPKIKAGSGISFDDVMSIGSLLVGEPADAYILGEISTLKKKRNVKSNQTCPKCGRKSLILEAPKQHIVDHNDPYRILKQRLVKGEISKDEYLELKKLIEE